VIKERYFTTPLALGSANKRPLPPPADPGRLTKRELRTLYNQKGKGKGKGRGKGKEGKAGKGAGAEGCAAQTPDGKRICFAFNNKAEPCSRKKCAYLHVCGRCFKDHPLWRCE